MTSFFFYLTIISAMRSAHTVYIQSKYIQNQVVHYFGKSIYRQSRAFFALKTFGF